MDGFNLRWLGLFALVASLAFGNVACSSDNNTSSSGGSNTGGILVTVTDVSDPYCLDHTYAATFSDFDARTDLNQIHLTPTANANEVGGLLALDQGTTGQLVYVFCDYSQGTHSYDENASFSLELTNYTNAANFNACGRSMRNVTDNYTWYLYSYYDSVASTTVYEYNMPARMAIPYGYVTYNNGDTPLPTTYYPFNFQNNVMARNSYGYYNYATYYASSYNYYYGVNTPWITRAGPPGDSFTSFTGDFGDSTTVAFSDMVFLGDADHPTEGGSIQEWCNCLLGSDQVGYYQFNNTTTPTTGVYNYFFGFRHYMFGSLANFTDTDRESNNSSGTCIMP